MRRIIRFVLSGLVADAGLTAPAKDVQVQDSSSGRLVAEVPVAGTPYVLDSRVARVRSSNVALLPGRAPGATRTTAVVR